MVQLREEQLQAFSEDARQRFMDRMVAHLDKLFPQQCGRANEARTRVAIEDGIERAAKYQLVDERDVCIFIELMYTFGRKFDENMKLPWAPGILRETHLYPALKIQRVWDVSRSHLDDARGLEGRGLAPAGRTGR